MPITIPTARSIFSTFAANLFTKVHDETVASLDNDVNATAKQPTFFTSKSPKETRTRSESKYIPSTMAPLSHLPKPTGKYEVGCHDVEWYPNNDYDDDSGVGLASQDGIDDESEGILLRMFYPTEPTNTKRKHPAWIPSTEYGIALGDFIRWPRWLTSAVTLGLTVHPTRAYLDTEILAGETKFPVIVFSHGLGGTRTVYSAFCTEMASQGFVVCALEHRDGTASIASFNNSTRCMAYQRASTPDLAEQRSFRQVQLKTRLSEVNLCTQFLNSLNQGKELGNKGEVDLTLFKDRIDMSNLVMAGHSFGAATSVEVLRIPATPFKCGILLDAWAQPLYFDAKPIQRPVLLHCSDQFVQWPENFALMKKLVHEANSSVPEELGRSFMFSLKGSAHQNYSDFVMIFSKFTRFIREHAGTIDPHLAMELSCRASLEFIRQRLTDTKVLPPEDTAIFNESKSKRPAEVVFQI